jgi:hypothetical protein
MEKIKFVLLSFEIFFFTTGFGQAATNIKVVLDDGIEEQIRVRMRPFYEFSGPWRVTVKEVNERNDTVSFEGKCFGKITQDSIRFKRDSAELKFDFTWSTQTAEDFMDIDAIRIAYWWDSGRYSMSVDHELRQQATMRSNSFPQFDDARRELFFVEQEGKGPIALTHWKFSNKRIVSILKQRRLAQNTFRTRLLIFERESR